MHFQGKKALDPRCRQTIQDRISCRQAGGAGSNIWCSSWVIQVDILPASFICLHQIFDEIFVSITHLPARYSILHHLPTCQIFDPESSACTEDTVLFCLGNAPGIQCFFALKIYRFFTAFQLSDLIIRYIRTTSKRINKRRSLKRKLIIKD